MLYITTVVILNYGIELNKRKWFPSPNIYENKGQKLGRSDYLLLERVRLVNLSLKRWNVLGPAIEEFIM